MIHALRAGSDGDEGRTLIEEGRKNELCRLLLDRLGVLGAALQLVAELEGTAARAPLPSEASFQSTNLPVCRAQTHQLCQETVVHPMPGREFGTTLLLQTLRAIVQSLDGNRDTAQSSFGGVELKEILLQRIALIERREPSSLSRLN
jgi:hypothetical protein